MKNFIKFCAVGIVNTVVSYVVYYFFVFLNPEYYIIGNVIGWFAAVTISYILNNKFVFRDTMQSVLKKIVKTYISYGMTLLIGTILLWIGKNLLNVSVWILPFMVTVMNVPINFFLNKYWVYSKGKIESDKWQ